MKMLQLLPLEVTNGNFEIHAHLRGKEGAKLYFQDQGWPIPNTAKTTEELKTIELEKPSNGPPIVMETRPSRVMIEIPEIGNQESRNVETVSISNALQR